MSCWVLAAGCMGLVLIPRCNCELRGIPAPISGYVGAPSRLHPSRYDSGIFLIRICPDEIKIGIAYDIYLTSGFERDVRLPVSHFPLLLQCVRCDDALHGSGSWIAKGYGRGMLS